MVNTKSLFYLEYGHRLYKDIRQCDYSVYDNLNIKDGYNLLTSYHYFATPTYKKNYISSVDGASHAIHMYDHFLDIFYHYDPYRIINRNSSKKQQLFLRTISGSFPTIITEFTNNPEFVNIKKDKACYINFYIEVNPGFSSEEFIDEKYDIVYVNSNIAIIYFDANGVMISEKYLSINFSYYNDIILFQGEIKPIMFYKVHNFKEISDFNSFIESLSKKDEMIINCLNEEYLKMVTDSLAANI